MVDISALLASLPRATGGPASVNIKLESPLPAGTSAPVALKVVSSHANGTATLALPDGTALKATLSPPLAAGSQLNLPVLPANGNPTQLAARLLPATTPSSASNAAPPRASPTAAAPLTATPVALANLPAALATAVAGTPTAISPPSLSVTPSPANSTTTVPTAPSPGVASSVPIPLPAGPLVLAFSAATQPTNTTPAALTLTLLGTPANAQGMQQATTLLPNQTSPTTVQVATGMTLPAGTTLGVQLPPATPANQTTGLPLTTALLTRATAPATTSPTPPHAPFTPPALSALKVLVQPPATNPASATPTPLAARVLTQPPATPPTTGSAPVSQTIVLANGQHGVVQSPAGLPAGSIIVADITPASSVAPVTRLEAAGAHTGQTGTAGTQTPLAPASTLPANLPAGTTLTGTVTAQQPALNQLTLTLTEGPLAGRTLTVSTPQQVPLESRLTITLEANGSATVVAVSLPSGYSQSHALTSLTREWPTLQQALSLLTQQQPASAATFRQGLPQLAALGATLLPYLDGVVRNDPARAFDRTSTQLLRALGVDFGADISQLQTLTQPTPEGWRGLVFPYLETPQGDPRQGGFFWRRQNNEADPTQPASTRFVVELGLSQLGPVQLDGLLNPPELWLKLRRTTPAEQGFTEGLHQLVQATLAELGLTGGISVETTPAFEVNPIAEILAHAHATTATEA